MYNFNLSTIYIDKITICHHDLRTGFNDKQNILNFLEN